MKKKLFALFTVVAFLFSMIFFATPASATVASCGSGYTSLGEDVFLYNASHTWVGTIHVYYAWEQGIYTLCATTEKAPIISGKASYTGVWFKIVGQSGWLTYDAGNYLYYAGPIYLGMVKGPECSYVYGVVTDYGGNRTSGSEYTTCIQ
ncbi:MAG TPA: hypothetical protein VIY48_21260 [Candidatus Paceibacterota bacterium]